MHVYNNSDINDDKDGETGKDAESIENIRTYSDNSYAASEPLFSGDESNKEDDRTSYKEDDESDTKDTNDARSEEHDPEGQEFVEDDEYYESNEDVEWDGSYGDDEQDGSDGDVEQADKEDIDIVQSSDANAFKEFLNGFYNYLTSPDSGNRHPRSALQCKTQVMTIISAIDTTYDINSLFNRNLIRDIFLKYYCKRKELHPRTIQSYLTSLEHFYEYILSEKFTAFDVAVVNSMIARVKTWRKSYIPQVKIAEKVKMERDRVSRIKPKDLLEFEATPLVRSIVKLLGLLSAGKKVEITQSCFTNTRDLILTEIYRVNAHRAGVLANMTLEEYENCELKNGKYFITVFKHKEAKAGPIRIIIKEKVFGWLKIYVEKVRPAVSNDSSNGACVTLTWTGGHFDNSGGISNAANALWKKAGMKGRIGANQFRKAAITAVRESCSADDPIHEDLANLMGHKKSTADRYYYLEDKMISAERAADKLDSIMHTVHETGQESDHENNAIELQDIEHQGSADRTPSRFKFTAEECHLIENTFADEIRNKKVEFSTVVERIQHIDTLESLSPKRVYNKVRRMIRQSAKQKLDLPQEKETLEDKMNRLEEGAANPNLADANNESDTEFVAPSTSSKSKDLFSKSDIKLLREGFGSVIKKRSVTDTLIQQAIKHYPSAKQISKKFEYQTIKNRLKYEVRLARRK